MRVHRLLPLFPRGMADERTRNLERAAAQGDVDATGNRSRRPFFAWVAVSRPGFPALKALTAF